MISFKKALYSIVPATLVCCSSLYASLVRSDFGKITDSDWEYILDSKLSKEKFQELRSAGITLDEYFQYPWIRYGLSEKDWIASRAANLLKAETEYVQNSTSEQDWAVVQNLFAPGYNQIKSQQTKGYFMMGTAALSALLYVFHDSRSDFDRIGFDFPHYLLILGADMLWSSIDIGYQINNSRASKIDRFSFDIKNPYSIQLSFTYSHRGNAVQYVQNVSP